jgi:hypothetical protein
MPLKRWQYDLERQAGRSWARARRVHLAQIGRTREYIVARFVRIGIVARLFGEGPAALQIVVVRCAFRWTINTPKQVRYDMNTERALSHHGVPVSGRNMRANRREGRRQDKSRKVRGGRRGKKSRNHTVRGKGARADITLLNAIIRWELCELDTLRFDAP